MSKITLPLERRHNAFYTFNTRKENLSTLYGLPQNVDMDMYDYEFNEDGSLKAIHKKIHVDHNGDPL